MRAAQLSAQHCSMPAAMQVCVQFASTHAATSCVIRRCLGAALSCGTHVQVPNLVVMVVLSILPGLPAAIYLVGFQEDNTAYQRAMTVPLLGFAVASILFGSAAVRCNTLLQLHLHDSHPAHACNACTALHPACNVHASATALSISSRFAAFVLWHVLPVHCSTMKHSIA